MSARDAAHSLASPQRLFDQTNLLVVTPSAPTFSAQDLHLHSPHDLKARLKVKSSDEPPNRTRRPPPERYRIHVAVHVEPDTNFDSQRRLIAYAPILQPVCVVR